MAMTARKMLICLSGALIRRPWLPAAAVVFTSLLEFLPLCILFGNQGVAGMNPWPELSDEMIVRLGNSYHYMSYVGMAMGIVLLTSPFVPLCFRRVRAAALILTWGVGAYLVGPAVKCVAFNCAELAVGETRFAAYRCVLNVALNEQIRIAKHNLRKKAEAEKSGSPWTRSPIPCFDKYRWSFGDDRYSICKLQGKEPVYELIDERWRPDQCCKGAWDSQRLLTDIVRWHEDGDRIFVTAKDGKRYYIVYGTGDLKEVK